MQYNDCKGCNQPIEMLRDYCDDCNENQIQLLRTELQKYKNEIYRLLNNPDFAHVKNCGVCDEVISKSTGKDSCINIKTAKLCYLCLECEDKFEKYKQFAESVKEYVNSNPIFIGWGCNEDIILDKLEQLIEGLEK